MKHLQVVKPCLPTLPPPPPLFHPFKGLFRLTENIDYQHQMRPLLYIELESIILKWDTKIKGSVCEK